MSLKNSAAILPGQKLILGWLYLVFPRSRQFYAFDRANFRLEIDPMTQQKSKTPFALKKQIFTDLLLQSKSISILCQKNIVTLVTCAVSRKKLIVEDFSLKSSREK